MARQRRYFRNLVQLPLASSATRVLGRAVAGLAHAQAVGRATCTIPQVRQVIQLEEYDAVPVERIVGFVFSFRKGRRRIVSDRTGAGKLLFEGTPAPWDLTAITRPRGAGRARRLRPRTSASAETVTRAVRDGIDEIEQGAAVHLGRPRRRLQRAAAAGAGVVHRRAGRHARAPRRLTFPMYAESGRSEVASTRMLVMPSSVEAGQPFLGRITRHELSHVAVGVRDDGAPAWVSEGLAEYLGAREIPPDATGSSPPRRSNRAQSRGRPAMPASASSTTPTRSGTTRSAGWRATTSRRPRRGPAVGADGRACTTAARGPATPTRTACSAGARLRRCRARPPAAARIRNIYG